MFFSPVHLIYPVREECSMTIAPHAPVTVCSSNQYTMNILAFSGLRRYGARNTGFIPGEKEAAFFSAAASLVLCRWQVKAPPDFPPGGLLSVRTFRQWGICREVRNLRLGERPVLLAALQGRQSFAFLDVRWQGFPHVYGRGCVPSRIRLLRHYRPSVF